MLSLQYYPSPYKYQTRNILFFLNKYIYRSVIHLIILRKLVTVIFPLSIYHLNITYQDFHNDPPTCNSVYSLYFVMSPNFTQTEVNLISLRYHHHHNSFRTAMYTSFRKNAVLRLIMIAVFNATKILIDKKFF